MRTWKRVVVVVALLVALIPAATYAQDENPLAPFGWRLDSIETLEAIAEGAGIDLPVRYALLSPDGTKVAWEDDEICVLDLATRAAACTPLPENLRSPVGLVWSPDGHFIATHEDAMRNYIESDIWLFDVQQRTYANITDDGVEGDIIQQPDALIDVLPTWDPATGDLYFIRYRANEEDEEYPYKTELMRTGPTGEPTLVRDLSLLFREPFMLFEWQYGSLQGSRSVISPDGSMLAIAATPRRLSDTDNHAVWLISLPGGAPQRLTFMRDVALVGMPSWIDAEIGQGSFVDGMAFAAHGSGMALHLANGQYSAELVGANLVYLDITSGSPSIVQDLRDVPDKRTFFTGLQADGVPWEADWMRSAALLPGGDVLVHSRGVPAMGSDTYAISARGLPPSDDAAPVRLLLISKDEYSGQPMFNTTSGGSGDMARVLIDGYLLTFSRID